ncbi:UxaA family hydrolase [Chloroflexota bacterium]
MSFQGYPRKDGTVGVRNYVGVISVASCANDPANWISENIEGCVPYTQDISCQNFEATENMFYRTFINLGKNPNLAAVLVVGPDCECSDVDRIVKGIAESGKPVASVKVHDYSTIDDLKSDGVSIALRMTRDASQISKREFPDSALRLGIECGGSTPLSGAVTNKAMGRALDILIANGGSGGFSETPEMIGAEHVFAQRAVSPEVGERMLEVTRRFEKRFTDAGIDLSAANPSRQNISDGISSLEEKSLGDMVKGGTTSLTSVLDYAEIPQRQGMFFMDTPGNDLASMTGLAASGAQIITYSTEGACPYGFPFVPVIKVTANEKHYNRYQNILDFLVETEKAITDIEHVSQSLFDKILSVASGEKTKSEIFRYYGTNKIWQPAPIA